jgi:hypothetical protein
MSSEEIESDHNEENITSFLDFEEYKKDYSFNNKNSICIENGEVLKNKEILDKGLSKKNYDTYEDANKASERIQEFNDKIEKERNELERINVFIGLYLENKTVFKTIGKGKKSKKIKENIKVTRVTACYSDLSTIIEYNEEDRNDNFQMIIELLIRLIKSGEFDKKTINICLSSSQKPVQYFLKYKIYRIFANRFKVSYDKFTEFIEWDDDIISEFNDHRYASELKKLKSLLDEKNIMIDTTIEYESDKEFKDIGYIFNVLKHSKNIREKINSSKKKRKEKEDGINEDEKSVKKVKE